MNTSGEIAKEFFAMFIKIKKNNTKLKKTLIFFI